VRVVIAEDRALLRDGLIRLLTAYGMEVVAAVDNGPTWWPPRRGRQPPRARGPGLPQRLTRNTRNPRRGGATRLTLHRPALDAAGRAE
jgi:hypothetical protein